MLYRIQEKAKGIGFEWDEIKDVWGKVYEELEELKEEVRLKSDKISEEYGDLLFSLINLSRYLNIEAENALEKTNQKFIKRFQLMEKILNNENKKMQGMPLEELDKYWEKAKKSIKEN